MMNAHAQSLQARSAAFRLTLILAALAAVLGSLVQVRQAIAEDLGFYSPEVASALGIVGSTPATSHLIEVIDRNEVQIRFVPMGANIFARYSVTRRSIEIDERWSEADPATLAAVIAHEATHAEDAVSGFLASGGQFACIDSEIRAFRISAEVWIAVYGAYGKLYPQDELEIQLNLIANRYQENPYALDELVRQAYWDQCSTAGAPTGASGGS
jgi:hypothetical protein